MKNEKYLRRIDMENERMDKSVHCSVHALSILSTENAPGSEHDVITLFFFHS